MRTREVWIHAVDLANGARFTSVPIVVLESLLTDIVGTWQRKGVGGELVIEVAGAAPVTVGSEGSDSRRVVRGPLAGVVRWPRRHRGVVKRARTRTAALALTVSLKSTAARPAESTNRR